MTIQTLNDSLSQVHDELYQVRFLTDAVYEVDVYLSPVIGAIISTATFTLLAILCAISFRGASVNPANGGRAATH